MFLVYNLTFKMKISYQGLAVNCLRNSEIGSPPEWPFRKQFSILGQ